MSTTRKKFIFRQEYHLALLGLSDQDRMTAYHDIFRRLFVDESIDEALPSHIQAISSLIVARVQNEQKGGRTKKEE